MASRLTKAILAATLAALFAVAAGSPIAAQSKSGDPRVAGALKGLGLKYKVNSSGNFDVTYNQGKGRSQVVHVMSATDTYNDVEIREIWSNAGSFGAEPEASDLIDLMVGSGKSKIGCWALEEQDDGGYLLFFTIKVPAEVSPEELQMMLEFAADVADEQELALFDADEY
jgi:hypothetical protein